MTETQPDPESASNAGERVGWRGKNRLLLGSLVIVALAQGAVWAVVTPPLSGPDENGHAAYAEYLAVNLERPTRSPDTGGPSIEMSALDRGIGSAPIIGHPEGRISWPAATAVKRTLESLPAGSNKSDSGLNSAATYPPLYYGLVAAAYKLTPGGNIANRLLAMRAVGVLLFGLTVALTWLLAGVVLAGLWPRVVATGLVALQPKLGFMSGVINPDILLITLTTGFLLAGALIIRSGLTKWRALALVAVTIAAAFTHPRGLFLVAPLVFVLWFALWQSARQSGSSNTERAAKLAGSVLAAAAIGVVSILVVRWGNADPASDLREFGSYIWQFYLQSPTFLQPFGPAYGYRQVFIETYFSVFGQIDTFPAAAFVDALQAAALVGLAALYTTVVARWSVVRSSWPIVLLLGGTVLSLLALLHLVAFRELQGASDPIITGRYLLCAVSVYGIAAAWICSSLPKRAGPFVAAPLLAVSAVLIFSGIGLEALRFYG
jgi:hypothetical protein